MEQHDATLLQEFVETGSQEAFATLVQKHLKMAYGAALRQLRGDSGLAAEVAQAAFIRLAQKARFLTPRSTLAPWLHRTVRLEALSIIRSTNRRIAREQ